MKGKGLMSHVFAKLTVVTLVVLLTGCGLFVSEKPKNDISKEHSPDKVNEQGENKVTVQSKESTEIYVPSEKEDIISIIRLPGNEVVDKIITGDRPANVVFIQERGKAFVTHRDGDSIGVIDLEDLKMIKEIVVGDDPHAFALTQDRKFLYVTTVGDKYIYVIDIEKEEVNRKIDLGSGVRTNYPFLYEDILYVTDHENRLVYSIQDDKIIQTYKVKGPPMVSRTSADGNLLYVASSSYGAIEVFNTKSGGKEMEIYSGEDVTDFVITVKESQLIATNKNENSVSIIDLSSGKLIKKINELAGPKHIVFNEDESKVYVSLSSSNKVASINLETLEIDAIIEVGRSPHGVQFKTAN